MCEPIDWKLTFSSSQVRAITCHLYTVTRSLAWPISFSSGFHFFCWICCMILLCFLQLEDGDIIFFQKHLRSQTSEQYRYPDVPSFLEYVHNRQVCVEPCFVILPLGARLVVISLKQNCFPLINAVPLVVLLPLLHRTHFCFSLRDTVSFVLSFKRALNILCGLIAKIKIFHVIAPRLFASAHWTNPRRRILVLSCMYLFQ